MRRAHVILTGVLLLLFVGLSFNAYACVVPLFGEGRSAMAGGCADPEEQPARQFCDAFKTLGVQAAPEAPKVFDFQLISWEDQAGLSFLANHVLPTRRVPAFVDNPPRDLIITTTVLRI